MSAPPPPSVPRLAAALAWVRLRSLWNGLRHAPGGRGMRLFALFGLGVAAAYVGLLVSALEVIGEVGGRSAQEAGLALVGGALALASLAAKVAGGEAVLGGGEGEFLLARPVSLPRLVLARGLAGLVTDLFEGLFLLPLFAAAVLVWSLGGVGFALGLTAAAVTQMAVSAAAQGAQILAVRLVPPRRRRALWAALGLGSALAMACVWAIGTFVLRRPEAAAAALGRWAPALAASPGALVAAPLSRLAAAGPGPALLALGGLLALAAAALGGAVAIAAWAARRGWEAPGPPWAEGGRLAPEGSGAIGVVGKDFRLLARDRTRLVALVALPVIFVGVQVFGSVGWDWSSARPTNLALLAYSLAAYTATLGPLGHMQAERRAFWILLTAPRSLARLLAAKATFWAIGLGALALIAFAALAAAGGFAPAPDTVVPGALAVVGAAAVAWLAVGVASGAADLSDERRNALGVGTTYLFMLTAGLYNVALVEEGPLRARIVLLFLAATALAFHAGVERARFAFDADAEARRGLSAGLGGVLAIVLATGRAAAARAGGALDGPGAAATAALVWSVLVAAAAAFHLVRQSGRAPAPGRPAAPGWTPATGPPATPGRGARAGLAALAAGLGLVLARRGGDPDADPSAAGGTFGAIEVEAGASALLDGAGAPGAALVVVLFALADELVVRGIVQRALTRAGGRRGAVFAVALSALLAVLVAPGAGGPLRGGAAAVAPAVVLAASGRLAPAILTRLAIALAPLW